MWCRQ
ncbi:unnamed protein product, partial [Acanthoscelides obtectus]